MRVTCYRILVAEYGRVHRLPFGIIHLHDGRRHIQLFLTVIGSRPRLAELRIMKLVPPQTLPLIVEAAIPQCQFSIFTLIGDIKRKHTRHSVEPAAATLMLPFVITYGIR